MLTLKQTINEIKEVLPKTKEVNKSLEVYNLQKSFNSILEKIDDPGTNHSRRLVLDFILNRLKYLLDNPTEGFN